MKKTNSKAVKTKTGLRPVERVVIAHHDPRYRVFICMAQMSNGKFYPMPYWGAGNSKREAAKRVREHLKENRIWITPKGKFTRRIRFDEYYGAL